MLNTDMFSFALEARSPLSSFMVMLMLVLWWTVLPPMRFEFNKLNKMLESTSVEEFTSFFQLLYQEKKDDGTLKEKERERLKKEVRVEINKELEAAHKRRQERGFSRDRYSHGRGRGYY